MKSIKLFFVAIGALLISLSACSPNEKTNKTKQELTQEGTLDDETSTTPAVAKLDHYKALYVINSSDDKRVKGALRNINNVLDDPRLKGKLEIELIVFSDGVEIYKKGSAYEETLSNLKDKGVALLQCENTLQQRSLEKSDLYPFVSYVPTGNGEIILRHYDGWAIIHP